VIVGDTLVVIGFYFIFLSHYFRVFQESGLQLVAREPPSSAACAAKISNRNSRFIASCNRNRPQPPEHSSLDSRRNLPANRQ
jgi:hypothetical protein